MFTDSVIARLPEMPVEEDAVAQLFASVPAPSPSPATRPNAFWHEPGNTMPGRREDADSKATATPLTAAAQAALVASAGQPQPAAAGPRNRSTTMLGAAAPQAPRVAAPQRRLPTGALGGPTLGPDGVPIPSATARGNSLPAGALRDGRNQRAGEPVMTAAEAEAAVRGTRTLEPDTNAPSGLDLDIPPANTNSMRPGLSGAPPSSMRVRPAISAVAGKNSLRPKSGAASSDAMAMGNPSLGASGAGPSETVGPSPLRTKTLDPADSIPPDSGEPASQRPRSGKERRAEARRAARRKAAKHLPPAPVSATKPRWDPARITLVAFASVLLIGALGLGAAEAGIWVLPPPAAAMLGFENAQASLSKTGPGQPHLVMPKAAEASNGAAVAPQVARVPTASVAPPPLAPPMAAAADALVAPEPAPVAEPAKPADPSAAVAATTTASVPSVAVVGTTTPARPLVMNPPPGAAAPLASVATSWAMIEPEAEPSPLAPPASSAEPSPTAATSASATHAIPSAAANLPTPAPRAPSLPPQAVLPAAGPQLPAATGQPASASVAGKAFVAPTAAQLEAAAPAVVAPSPYTGDSIADADDFAAEEMSSTPGDRALALKMVALARNKLRARDAPGAAAMMLRQVTNDPQDHRAMEVLVRAWIAMGRGEDAVGYAELIVRKRPRRASYRVLEGDARLSAGDAAGAQVAWRVALQLEPDNVEAKRRLALQ